MNVSQDARNKLHSQRQNSKYQGSMQSQNISNSKFFQDKKMSQMSSENHHQIKQVFSNKIILGSSNQNKAGQ